VTPGSDGLDLGSTVRAKVRERYGGIAARGSSCCGGGSCCGGSEPTGGCGESMGYSSEDLKMLPEGAFLGLGCGNPTALTGLAEGETVLDLGSGAGVDCFLAARKVGEAGRIIGVDMTAEMVERARGNARTGGYGNVEFRLGEIEHLPVPDRSVDVVISNCVINLSADQKQVYREAFRALRPGGRLLVSDMVAMRPIPPEARADLERWAGCSSGALSVGETTERLRSAGFVDIVLTPVNKEDPLTTDGAQETLGVVPMNIRAVRPPVESTLPGEDRPHA
jgi:arsenite methyltransferase